MVFTTTVTCNSELVSILTCTFDSPTLSGRAYCNVCPSNIYTVSLVHHFYQSSWQTVILFQHINLCWCNHHAHSLEEISRFDQNLILRYPSQKPWPLAEITGHPTAARRLAVVRIAVFELSVIFSNSVGPSSSQANAANAVNPVTNLYLGSKF